MYNKVVEECFFKPRHAGMLDLKLPLTVHCRTSQKTPALVIIDLYLECTVVGIINKVLFKTNGNPYVIASLEWWCRQIQSKNLAELLPINYQVLVKELAIPTAQYPTALQVEDTFKEVLELMRKKFEDKKS